MEESVVPGHDHFQKPPLFPLHLVYVASFQHFYHSGKVATDNPEASGQSCISIKLYLYKQTVTPLPPCVLLVPIPVVPSGHGTGSLNIHYYND